MAFSEDFDETSSIFLYPKDIILLSCIVFLKGAIEGESPWGYLQKGRSLIEYAIIDLILIGKGNLPLVLLIVMFMKC